MEISEKDNNKFWYQTGKVPEKPFSNRQTYRQNLRYEHKYSWQVSYRHTELFISSDSNLEGKFRSPLEEIYSYLDLCIKREASFKKSLSPVQIKPYFPESIKNMCRLSAVFNVGPMAAVAGAVNDFLASSLEPYCENELILENGGDLYVRSGKSVNIGVYVRNRFFKDAIIFKVEPNDMPCGICASSGMFGHSLSFGKCDLAVVISDTSTGADAAATAVANSINTAGDIERSLNYFKELGPVRGLLVIKEDKIGIWGKIKLV